MDPSHSSAGSVASVQTVACSQPSVGSGVVLSPSTLLTNAHVIAGSSGPIVVRTIDGRELEASLSSIDVERDLALLDVDDLHGTPVALGRPVAGAEVEIAVVDTEGVLRPIQTTIGRVLEITSGDIYDLGNVERVGLELPIDLAPGNSGAGIFDADGKLLGIMFADSREREVSYGLAAEEIEAFVEQREPTTDPGPCR